MDLNHPDLLPDPDEPAKPDDSAYEESRRGKCICPPCCGLDLQCWNEADEEDLLCFGCRVRIVSSDGVRLCCHMRSQPPGRMRTPALRAYRPDEPVELTDDQTEALRRTLLRLKDEYRGPRNPLL